MKKKFLGIVLCLAMLIGLFPMDVKAADADPEKPTEITLTFNLDGFKYFSNGYFESEADERSQNNNNYGDNNIRYYILLDETSAKFYFLTPMGLYKKDSSGNFVKANSEDKYLNSATDYYLDFEIKTIKGGDSVYNSLITNSFAIKKISLNGKEAEPYTAYGGYTHWRISIGKPGILFSDVDELSINDLEVRYGKHIPNLADMEAIYNTEDNKRYKLTDLKWTKSGSSETVTDTTFTDGEYSLTAVFTINKKTSGDFVCEFAGDENKNIKSFKVNGHECGNETIISDDGHTLTLTHTLPKVTLPIKDIEFTMGELTYLLDNGENTETDLAKEIGPSGKLKLNKAEDFSYDAGKEATYRRKAGESEITEISLSDKVSDDYTYFVKVGCCLADGASWEDNLEKYVGTPSDHRLLVDGVQKELIKIEPYVNVTTDSKADYYITFEVGSPKRYAINVSGGKAYVGDAADNPRKDSYAGLNFTLSADAPEGCKTFKEWNTEGVTVADPLASKTTFVMPAGNIKIEAVFEAAEPDFTGAERTYTWTGDSCTATVNCTKCNGVAGEKHAVSETVTGTYVKDTDATCTAAETGHYEAEFTNAVFAKQSTAAGSVTKGSAPGHTYGAPVYTWSEDNCTAKAACTGCTDNVTETKAGTYVKDTDATCTAAETGHYEATFDNALFAKQSTAAGSVTKGSALDHSYGAPVYTWSKDSCSAKAACTRTGCAEAVTETKAAVYVTDSAATCTAAETGHYEVSFENALFAKQSTATGSLTKGSAIGHKDADNNGKCDRCMADIPGYVPVTPAPVTPAPVTPAPVTPAPADGGSTTPAPVTPAPADGGSTTPAPVTPAPADGGSTTGKKPATKAEVKKELAEVFTENKVAVTTKKADAAVSVTKKDSAYYDVNGKKITSSFIRTSDNRLRYVGTTGKSVKKAVVASYDAKTGEMKMYYAGKNGVIVTDKVVTLADGSRIFASNDGTLATNEIVTSGKHQYYADENGKLVTNSVVKMKDGTRYYTNKYGYIRKNAIVTDSLGYKHYATADGSLAKSCWVTVGDTMYWCSKNTRITKTKNAE